MLLKNHSDATLSYIMKDIKDTLLLHYDKPVNDPYVLKLYKEYDAVLEEMSKRCVTEYKLKFGD
tara:strand:+ start:2128 stop:2319 length:192 start_codon:yes stop_codon:yes gene_type:complete